MNPTLDELRGALEATGDWPIRDYIPEAALDALGRRHRSWPDTIRDRIRFVAPDDDINYTVLGMLILEEHGLAFGPGDVRDMWLRHLPISMTFGPERTLLVKAGINHLSGGRPEDLADWVEVLNPADEKCGALIRADAYGYACAGRPALAAELAWRDASWTHRRTGIYCAMFVSAAIAAAAVLDAPLDVFRTALQFVPQRSRFYRIAADSLEQVSRASDWLDGYRRIHGRYAAYDHCLIYQEVGTLMNTLRFAESVGEGICIQVSQGNDTDSFGATAGSLLGVFLGPGHLEERWLAPFGDDLRTTLAQFYERSLAAVAERMGRLLRVAEQVGMTDVLLGVVIASLVLIARPCAARAWVSRRWNGGGLVRLGLAERIGAVEQARQSRLYQSFERLLRVLTERDPLAVGAGHHPLRRPPAGHVQHPPTDVRRQDPRRGHPLDRRHHLHRQQVPAG